MPYQQLKNIGGGLQKLPSDSRDFKLGALVRFPRLEEIPDDFLVGSAEIYDDQRDSDLCTAFTVTRVSSEQEEGKKFSVEYQFGKTKAVAGGDYRVWGANLRDACKSAVKYGSLPRESNPHDLWQKGRDFVANPKNWDVVFDPYSFPFRKKTFFAVQGPYDTFDDIRATLWLYRNEKRQVMAGALWRPEWTGAFRGVIDPNYGKEGFGHAFRIVGCKKIKGELHLICPLSSGTELGEKGVFYFPRAVVNKEFGDYGVYTFQDISREEAEKIMENNRYSFWKFLKDFWVGIKVCFT